MEQIKIKVEIGALTAARIGVAQVGETTVSPTQEEWAALDPRARELLASEHVGTYGKALWLEGPAVWSSVAEAAARKLADRDAEKARSERQLAEEKASARAKVVAELERLRTLPIAEIAELVSHRRDDCVDLYSCGPAAAVRAALDSLGVAYEHYGSGSTYVSMATLGRGAELTAHTAALARAAEAEADRMAAEQAARDARDAEARSAATAWVAERDETIAAGLSRGYEMGSAVDTWLDEYVEDAIRRAGIADPDPCHEIARVTDAGSLSPRPSPARRALEVETRVLAALPQVAVPPGCSLTAQRIARAQRYEDAPDDPDADRDGQIQVKRTVVPLRWETPWGICWLCVDAE